MALGAGGVLLTVAMNAELSDRFGRRPALALALGGASLEYATVSAALWYQSRGKSSSVLCYCNSYCRLSPALEHSFAHKCPRLQCAGLLD